MLASQFQIKPSFYLSVCTVITLLTTMLIVLLMSLAIGLKIILLGVLIFYGRQTFLRTARLKTDAITTIICGQGNLKINVGGVLIAAHLCPESVITAVISVLKFKTQTGVKNAILLRDSLPPDHYRQLIICLKL